MTIDKNSLKSFAAEIQELYEERSMLTNIATVRDYQSKKDSQLEYVRFGKRIGVPTNVFDHGMTQPTSSSLIHSVVNGERKFVLTDLANLAGNERFGSSQLNRRLSIEDLKIAVETVPGADRLFLPTTDEYTESIKNWIGDDSVLHSGRSIVINGTELEINSVPSSYGIKDVIVANSSKVLVVQKKYEDTKPPKGMDFDHSLTGVNEGQRLMVYFAKESQPAPLNQDFEEEIEIIYRSVISQPVIEERGVFILEAPTGLTFSNNNGN